MSLILEALRKSEAERRRGAAPNLYSELPPAAVPTARRIDARWAAGLGVALLLAIVLWRTQDHDTTGPADAATVTAPEGDVVSAPPALKPVRRLSPMPARRASIPAATTPGTPMANATAPVAVARPPSAERDAPSAGAAPAMASAPTPRATPASAPAPVSAPAATAIVDTPQSLSDLSADERKALPPLKISMHLWNPDPAQRFVIIDGNRLREGDRVGDAVLTAIVADGVVLDWNGRKLKLPIR
jgi:general secretion pathway protein B